MVAEHYAAMGEGFDGTELMRQATLEGGGDPQMISNKKEEAFVLFMNKSNEMIVDNVKKTRELYKMIEEMEKKLEDAKASGSSDDYKKDKRKFPLTESRGIDKLQHFNGTRTEL